MKTAKKALALFLAAVLLFTSCSEAAPTTSGPETTHTAYGLEFVLKDSWTMTDEDNTISITFDKKGEVYFLMMPKVATVGTLDLNMMASIADGMARSISEEAFVESINQTTIMGYPAYEVIIHMKRNGKDFGKFIYWFVFTDSGYYIIGYAAPWGKFDVYLPSAQYLLDSMRIIEEDTNTQNSTYLNSFVVENGVGGIYDMRFVMEDNWSLVEGQYIVFTDASEGFLSFVPPVTTGGIDVEELTTPLLDTFASSLGGTATITSTTTEVLNGNEIIVCAADISANGTVALKFNLWMIQKDGYVYMVMYIAPAGFYAANIPNAQALVASIEFV